MKVGSREPRKSAQAHLIFHKTHYGLLKGLTGVCWGLGVHSESVVITLHSSSESLNHFLKHKVLSLPRDPSSGVWGRTWAFSPLTKFYPHGQTTKQFWKPLFYRKNFKQWKKCTDTHWNTLLEEGNAEGKGQGGYEQWGKAGVWYSQGRVWEDKQNIWTRPKR